MASGDFGTVELVWSGTGIGTLVLVLSCERVDVVHIVLPAVISGRILGSS